MLLLLVLLPDFDNLENYEFDLPTIIYDTNNKIIGELASKKRILIQRRYTKKDERSIIAIEDHYFYSHIGINIKRILKTIWLDLTSLSFVRGLAL